MDIGNLPIFKNKTKDKCPPGTPKDDWQKIGDYEGETSTNVVDTCDDDEEGCINNKENTVKRNKTAVSDKERKESDEAAAIASQAATQQPKKK